MNQQLTPEQQKGNLLREFDGMVKLAAIDRELCVDVAAGVFGRNNGGDHNAARAQAENAVTTIEMMAQGQFGFSRAAKSMQQYFHMEESVVQYIDGEIIE